MDIHSRRHMLVDHDSLRDGRSILFCFYGSSVKRLWNDLKACMSSGADAAADVTMQPCIRNTLAACIDIHTAVTAYCSCHLVGY